MAQVRKYSTGGETSPKLLKREGYGDYNVADIESQYAKNLNGILDEMGLEGEDRQKTIETTKNILSNITNGTINTINSSGQWIVPKEYSSTGYNTYKNAGLFGIKGKKVVRDQNFYNNTAYYILDKVLDKTNTYTAKKEDPKKEKVNPDQSFEQYLNKYYFNDDKATFDKKLWDYSTAKQGIIDRLKEYRDIISKSDMTDAAKTDYLSRIDSGITGLTDDTTTNDYSSLARLGWSKPYMWLDEKFDETPEQKAAREAKEKAETQAEKGLEQSSISSNTENNSNNNLDLYYDPSTRKTIYGTIKNGIFFPSKGRPFPLSATWDSKNPTYYSKENLSSLMDLINTGQYDDKIINFYESIKNLHNKESLPESVKDWFNSYKLEEKDDGKIHIRTNDFTIPLFTTDYNPDNSFLTLFRRQFGIEPSIPIEKGSYQDKRLEYTEELGKKFNENVGDSLINFVKSLFTSYKQPEYVIDKKAKGGNIIKYKNPAQPMTHIQAKNMDKWNRNNALSGYNIAKDIEDYLNSGLDLDTYISAFNGGEDIYDKMVGNTDYFNGKNVVYKETPLAKQRQVSFRSTNRGFDDLIRSAIIGHGTTEGKDSYDEALGDRTYNRTLGWINADQAKNFNNQINKYGIEFYLDPGSGHYRLRRTAIPTVNLPEVVVTPNNVTTSQTTTNTNPTTSVTNQNTDTGTGAYDTDKDKEIKTPYFDNLLAAGRLAGTLYTNNKVAKTVSESLEPLVLTPNRIRRQVRGDLPTKTFYENQAAESNRLDSRPITSDANLQLAQQLMYNDRALKLKMQGFLADKEAIDKTSLLAQQANEQNQANAVEVANKNRASMLGIQQAKANIEASRRSANWQQAWNPFLSSMEQKYTNYSKQLSALNRDAANTVELRKLDAASKQAQSALDSVRTKWLAANSGKSEYDWLNSDEYKNAYKTYETAVTNAGNAYKDTMSKYDLNNLRKPYSFLMFKSGGSTKDIAIENMKELNKTFRKNEELFHKIIMDSKKENNKLIMNLSSLTKELIIKSMTI